MKLIIALLTSATLAGCAGGGQSLARGLGFAGPSRYDKPGLTEAQMRSDWMACKYDAEKSVQGSQYIMVDASRKIDLTVLCMESKGYTHD